MKVIKENISNLKADIDPAEDAVVTLDPTMAGAIDFSNRKEKEMQEIMDERTPEIEEDEEREEIIAKLNLDEALFDEEICPICGDDVDEPCEDCKKEMEEDIDINANGWISSDLKIGEDRTGWYATKDTGLTHNGKPIQVGTTVKTSYGDSFLNAYNPEKDLMWIHEINNQGEFGPKHLLKDFSKNMDNHLKENFIEEDITARSHTDDLISAIEDGFLDWETVGFAALKYLSDDDVKELCDMNEWAIGTDFEEELNEDASDSDVEEEPIIEEDISDVAGSVGDIIKTNIFPKMDNVASTNDLLELVKAEFAEIDPKFRKYADEVIRNLAKKPFAKACIYLGDIMLKGAGLGSPDIHECAENKSINEEVRNYKQEFIDFCKGKIVEDLGQVDITSDPEDDEPIIHNVDMIGDVREFNHVRMTTNEDYEGLVCVDDDGNIVIDTIMVDVFVIAARRGFDQISREFYNNVLEYWDDQNMDDIWSESDESIEECAEQPLKEEKSAWDKIQELLGEPIELDEDTEVDRDEKLLARLYKGTREQIKAAAEEMKASYHDDPDWEEQRYLNQKEIDEIAHKHGLKRNWEESLNEEAKEDISLYDRVYIDLDKQSGDDAKYRKFGKEFNSRRYDGPNEIFTAREDDGITVAADDLSFAQEVADAYDLDTKDDELDVKRIDEEGNEVWVTIPALTILIPEEFEEDIESLKGLVEAYNRHFH